MSVSSPIFAFVINDKKESTLEAVEVAKCIAQKKSDDSILEESKFKAQQKLKYANDSVLEVSENTLFQKLLMASKIPWYWIFRFF